MTPLESCGLIEDGLSVKSMETGVEAHAGNHSQFTV